MRCKARALAAQLRNLVAQASGEVVEFFGAFEDVARKALRAFVMTALVGVGVSTRNGALVEVLRTMYARCDCYRGTT